MVQHLVSRASSANSAKSTTFSTREFAAGEQFDAWRQYTRELIDVRPIGRAGEFCVDHTAWDLGSLILERTCLPAERGRRWYHRPRSHLDYSCLVLAFGPPRREGGREACLSFRSLAEPFEGVGYDEEVLVLYLPRASLPKELAAIDSTGEFARSGSGQLLAAYLVNLASTIDDVAAEAWPDLAAATSALVTACLCGTAERTEEAERPLFSALRERARRVVRANLGAPDFRPDTLARLLFVSRSKLYRIFEASGGVAHFIQQERLAEAHRRLTQDIDTISISALSLEVGFRDHSAFSRAFKAEFGVSPREARESALARRLAESAPEADDAASDDPYRPEPIRSDPFTFTR